MVVNEALLQLIADVQVVQVDARKRIAALNKEMMQVESTLIEANLTHERLVEELRVYNSTTVCNDPTPNELDIERFRLALPELLKRKP